MRDCPRVDHRDWMRDAARILDFIATTVYVDRDARGDLPHHCRCLVDGNVVRILRLTEWASARVF